jgi:hypothetical protein
VELGNAIEEVAENSIELDRLLERVERATTHYEVLGVLRSATSDEVKQAHLQAVTLLHPAHYTVSLVMNDQLLSRVDSALTKVSEAFSALSQVVARIEYDYSLDQQPRRERLGLCIAASVTGYDRIEGKWHEIARTVEVGRTGVSLRMRRQVARGCVLQLTLPMPAELRQHDHGDSAYEVFGIVRRVEPVIGSIVDAGSQVEVDFLGRRPPVGYLSKPWAIFNITSSPDHNS